MGKMIKYICSLLLLIGCVQVDAKEENVTAVDYSKMSKTELNAALISAIREGYSGTVEQLIKEGANVNDVTEDENTPLIIAVQHARAISEFSLQAQEKARSRWSQRRRIIQTLLKAGANVSHVDKYGRTALMYAVKEHDLNTVESLLQVPEMSTGSFFGLGTKPINYADQDGNTALILAVQSVRYRYISGNNQEYNICKNSQNILKALMETPGIDPHHVNNNGDTAITLHEELKRKINGYPY